MQEYQMTNKETAEHFRKYVTEEHSMFSWPTDGCGYNQSVRFSQYRNENWRGGSMEEFKCFMLDYAAKIEKEPDTLCKCIHPNVAITFLCYCCDEPSCKYHGERHK